MKFSFAAVLAFAAAALAKPILLNSNYDVQEGVPFTLKWNNAQGPVTITLMTGADSDNLDVVGDIATDVTENEFTFTPKDLPSGIYAFRISDASGVPNYSKQFEYEGTGSISSSSSSLSMTSTSSSSSASSTSSSSSESSSSTTSSETSSITSSSSSTTTRPASSTREAAPTNTPPNNNSGQRFASPLALVFVTVAALVFFN